MKELKCPKCGNMFQVDDAEYASIANQVKNQEFDAELERRLSECLARHKAEQTLAAAKVEQQYNADLSKKDMEIGVKTVEIERLKNELESSLERLRSEKEQEIAGLKNQLENIAAQKDAERTLALAEKEKTIAELSAAIEQGDSKVKIAVMEEQKRSQQVIEEKNAEINRLISDAKLERFKAKETADKIIEQYQIELRNKQEQVDYYKDLKTRMSTKMVGETLEQHCSIEFERYIRPMMPEAFFDKDNDAIDGTKGDFIFRAFEEGTEYISIMFEMKNEMDTTTTKHKNDDFLKKLDDDRKKKGCEFAVLVSLLEADNDLYNNGIVNKSHIYPKMYVIRPQFFVPFINLLVQTSRKSLEYRKQLILAQSKEVDITKFENKLLDFKNKFGRHYELASRRYGEAIKQIDDTIVKLQRIKENLVTSENNLRLAQQDTEDLTIRKLTYGNPTMKQKFNEARSLSSDE